LFLCSLDLQPCRFESWWTHLYNDTSVFDSYKPTYNPRYLSAPLSADDLSLIARLPPGFSHLARSGEIATDIIDVLSNIVSYGESIGATWPTYDGYWRFPKKRAHMPSPAALRAKKRHEDFWQACSCLLVPGPNFEKYLVFALLLFVSVAFAPGESGRKYLACSHTAFRTPRACLTRELPAFEPDDISSSPPEGTDPTDTDRDQNHDQNQNQADVEETMQQCLIWMWLVLIESWRATDGVDSNEANRLQDLLKLKFPGYVAWEKLNVVLGRFFCTEDMISSLKHCWVRPRAPDLGVVPESESGSESESVPGDADADADAGAFSSSLGNQTTIES
jgi:hypothetical protein